MYFALVFLGVFVFMSALLLLKFADVKAPRVDFNASELVINTNVEAKGVSGWVKKISELKTSAEVLPVNIMYIEIDDNYPRPKPPAPKKHYEIIVPNCTDYSIFCMRRLANSMDIDLSIAKVGDNHTIIIAAPSAAAANSFVNGLKQYNIKSKIKAVK